MDVRAGLHELGGEPERLRRRVRVLEAARVRDERDVERLRDLGRQLDPELGEEVAEDLARRGRVGDDEIDVPEAVVVVVVVDVDDERRLLEQRRVGPEPALVRAVEREDDPLGRVVGQGPCEAFERHEAVLVRERDAAGQVHDPVLPQRVQGKLHGQDGAEGVSVRVFMGGDDEAVVRSNRIYDRGQVSRLRCPLG